MLLTQNKNPNAFLSRFWAVTHEDTLRVMWPQISQYLGFVGVCGRWRWALDGGSTWTQRGVLGQNPLFASFAHTHGHCHQKKAFWGKKKKKSPSLQETSLRQFFLLSCNLLSCLCRPSDPAGFSHPFSQQMPKSGRRVGVGRLRWGPNNHEKQLWWWLAGRPDPVYPSSSLIFSWLFD